MELLGFWIPNWLLVLVFLLLTAYTYFTWHFGELDALGLKGPRPVVLFGNMLQSLKAGVLEYDVEMIKKFGKVYGFYLGRIPTVVVADPDMIKRILVKDFHHFEDRMHLPLRGVLKYSVFDVKGQEWKRVRNLLTPAFSGGKLKLMTQLINGTADSCLDNLQRSQGQPFEAKSVGGGFTMDTIASVAFGYNIDSQKNPDDPFCTASTRIVKQFLPTSLWFSIFMYFGFLVPLLELINYTPFNTDFLSDFVKKALIERRTEAGVQHVDFLKLMLDAEKHLAEAEADPDTAHDGQSQKHQKKGLTEEQIIAQAVLFLAAGHDTTATTLAFLMYNLATNPQIQDRVVAEKDEIVGTDVPTYEHVQQLLYLDMCIEESLRIYPAVDRFTRDCTEDIEIDGFHIPKGMSIMFPLMAMHRDPNVWEDPLTFKPERFTAEAKAQRHPYVYMPFGLGPRHCIGMRLAQTEIKILVVRILQMYRIATCDRTQVPLKLNPKAFFVQAENGIWLKVEKREAAMK